MTATELLNWLTHALFVAVFVVTGLQAARRPCRANIDIALLFGSVATFVVASRLTTALGLTGSHLILAAELTLILAIPYLLLRLVEDFSDPPRWLTVIGLAAFIGLAALGFVVGRPYPAWFTLLVGAWFVGLGGYAAVAFIREARRSGGVTRRRMQAAAVGTLLVAATIGVAVVGGVITPLRPVTTLVTPLLSLAAAVAYFLAFATPQFLRRAWQAPELRAFLRRASELPRLPTVSALIDELQRGAAESTGAPSAAIGLWDEAAGVLRFNNLGESPVELRPGVAIAGQAFARNQAIFAGNAPREDPEHAEGYRASGATAVLAAPIRTEDRPIGVLTVYAPRPPIFADDDLELVQLLAAQAAVILESRTLIDQAGRVRAMQEAARLKDDFLSTAAHDLKTPLTTLLAEAQLLEHRAAKNPSAPPEAERLRRIVGEARRIRELVVHLLDASRAEQDRSEHAREPADLAELARESCDRHRSDRHRLVVDVVGRAEVAVDRIRVMQLIDNLVENAIKYSPQGGEVRVTVWREDGEARLTVSDPGIGIPPADLLHVFDRFQRAGNVDDRRFAGMGLGLYICRQVVREHGGRIWVTSQLGSGSTFHVALPVADRSLVMSEVA